VSKQNLDFLNTLESVIRDRLRNPVDGSYTASLVAQGPKRMAQKVGEEAVELALAAVAGSRDEMLGEAADLVYHLLVLLNDQGIDLGDVTDALEARHTGR
jgi:phosphoribosyl-AMP cyclohydrolase / phosphoribosyl-ATP pyrophosphohydrolase